jgi:hypothetical protein
MQINNQLIEHQVPKELVISSMVILVDHLLAMELERRLIKVSIEIFELPMFFPMVQESMTLQVMCESML